MCQNYDYRTRERYHLTLTQADAETITTLLSAEIQRNRDKEDNDPMGGDPARDRYLVNLLEIFETFQAVAEHTNAAKMADKHLDVLLDKHRNVDDELPF